MKCTKFLNLFMASVVLVTAAAGCTKNPKNITNIPGQRAPARETPDGSNPIGANQPPINMTGSRGTPIGEIPEGGKMFTNEDRAALSAQTIYFEFDRSAIKPSEQPKLDLVATYMKNNANTQLKIEGNCDDRGTEEYNRALGERRAIAAREYLIQKHNIGSERITTVSYGEDKPADPGKTEEAYAKNRRDEFVVLKP